MSWGGQSIDSTFTTRVHLFTSEDLTIFIGAYDLSVLMCRKAANQSTFNLQLIDNILFTRFPFIAKFS